MIQNQAKLALEAIHNGDSVAAYESRVLDFKEEAGRRGPDGGLAPSSARNEAAAKALAEEAACLANTDGGLIVVGIDDAQRGSDAFVGSQMDTEWLRRRIWELVQPNLTTEVNEWSFSGVRLLVIRIPRSYRLHRAGRRFKHRIDDSCVEMTPEHQRRAEEERVGADFTAELAAKTTDEVSGEAIETVRAFLRQTAEPTRAAMAERPTADLLRALGLARGTTLNLAGEILLCANGRTWIDYRRRAHPGSDSLDRLELEAPLIVAYRDLMVRLDASNDARELHLSSGVHTRLRLIPPPAVREAVVNALMHRDYRLADPVDIEWVGAQLHVTSPGPFPLGVTADNIITARSSPRNTVLATVFRSLRLAEHEGIGVDRMFRDMAKVGHALPTIQENQGAVRCVLIGGEPSAPLVELFAAHPDASQDVDIVLVLHVLQEHADIGVNEVSRILQKTESEAKDALGRTSDVGLITLTTSSSRRTPRYRLSDSAREALHSVLPYLTTSSSEAEEFVISHLLTHDKIRPRDVSELLGVSYVQASRILREIRESGVIKIGSKYPTGRGTFHIRGGRFNEARSRLGL
jgi:ATP-dependent DNA helicase RecG